MTNLYQITAKSGQVQGTFKATSEQEARDLCAKDAGYANEAAIAEALGYEDKDAWTVQRITSPLLDRAAIVATLAASLPALRTYLPNPRDVARELLDFINARHYTVKIEWLWVGRERHGVVHIFDRAGECVFLTEYVRTEQGWGDTDALLTSCNRGSNKHHALIRALAYMRSLPRRQCGGVSDNLPH